VTRTFVIIHKPFSDAEGVLVPGLGDVCVFESPISAA
jgi:hypothetical protein